MRRARATVNQGALTRRFGGPTLPNITSIQIYCSYGGGARGGNYTIYYSDDGTNFTSAFSGNMTASSCGIIAGVGGGNGSYGGHAWWRFVMTGATTLHFPRASRIDFLDASSKVYNLVTFVADNCNDLGSIAGGDYSATITKKFT
jgi:hypothetical protein